MATDWNALGWDGWSLGTSDENADQIKVLAAETGVTGFVDATVLTESTPNINGGIVMGRSVDGERTITIPKMLTRKRSKARAFAATMRATNDEGPLEMAGLIYADDTDITDQTKGTRVCVFARPDGVQVPVDALSTGKDVIHLFDAAWIAADPTVYSLAETVVTGSPAAGSHSLSFTNAGTMRTRAGRAWTLTITASTIIKSPFVQLGAQRVEWPGLRLMPGERLTVDRHRHSYVGSMGVDGWARTGASRHLDYPTLKPGANNLLVGVGSGTCNATLRARSTW